MTLTLLAALAVSFSLATPALGQATALQRHVQVVEVDFEKSTITLQNLHPSDAVDLTGWRFCTHDDNESRRYSGASGLTGLVLQAGESLEIHYLNDAPDGSGAIDRSTIGGSWALPLDSGAYGLGLYISSGFGDGTTIVDHLQWSIGGIDNTTADARSFEAVQEGNVWTEEEAWIPTAANSTGILLADPDGSKTEQGPADYTVINPSVTIEVSGLVKLGASVTADIEAGGAVDVWRSSDLLDFGSFAVRLNVSPGSGVLIDDAAPEGAAFYLLLPAGSPAP